MLKTFSVTLIQVTMQPIGELRNLKTYHYLLSSGTIRLLDIQVVRDSVNSCNKDTIIKHQLKISTVTFARG